MNRSFFVFFLLIFQSCDWFVKNQQQDKDVVAQVGSSFFYVDDIVYDPFMGVGSTGEASLNLNRKFAGIELEKKYFLASEKRLKKFI